MQVEDNNQTIYEDKLTLEDDSENNVNSFSENKPRENFVSFYPNPYSKSVSIKYSSAFSELNNINIYNAEGNCCLTQMHLDDFIGDSFLNSLENGLYYVHISNLDGKITNSKLIKVDE